VIATLSPHRGEGPCALQESWGQINKEDDPKSESERTIQILHGSKGEARIRVKGEGNPKSWRKGKEKGV
jgi:hypothetical protein